MYTLFKSVYDRFLGKITDDMYLELTPQDTIKDLQNLLIDAIPGFEFPRKQLNYVISSSPYNEGIPGFAVKTADGKGYIDTSYFLCELSSEEINILAILMMNSWLQRQVTTIENIRMKYSGTDFKMTSQANHLAKLLTLLAETQRQSHHMQRLYKRRKTDAQGNIKSNWSSFRKHSVINGYDDTDEDNSDSGSGETIKQEITYDGGLIS